MVSDSPPTDILCLRQYHVCKLTCKPRYHPHLLGRPQITLLLHLASGLAEELGIERFPHTCSENPRPEYKLSKRRVPTFEEHRVICGLFYLTSMFSGCFRKVNAMSWSPYLEHCVNELEQARQFEADMLLVELVRSQYLIERTTALQSRQGGAPTHMFINALKADLDALKQRALYADQENILLQMQHLVAEVHIYGLSLMDIIENDKSSLPAQLDNLFMLISKSKSLFATFYRVPIQDYLIMPFAVFGQYAHSFITYTRLASLEVDGWDTKHLRSEMQFAANVEESLAHFDAAINCGPQGIAVKNEVFAKWSYRLRWMKGIYESRSVESQGQDVEDADAAVAQQGLTGEQDPASAVDQHYQQPTPPDDLLSSDLFSYLDDSFWQGFPVGFDDSFRDLPMQTQPSISKQGLMQQGLLPPVASTDHLEYEQTRYYR
nr:hypothetical protein CFP56_53559 [Quercus suber]